MNFLLTKKTLMYLKTTYYYIVNPIEGYTTFFS